MAKSTSKATKSQRPGATRPKVEFSVPVRIDTHGLFQESEKLIGFAQNVLDKLDGSKKEKADLQKFLAALDDVQSSIKGACEKMEGGNPMFHDFKIKCRA
jgi:hypothetical protein